MTSQTDPRAQRPFLTRMLSDETTRTNLLLAVVCLLVLVLMTAMRPTMFMSSYNFESMAFFMPELGILSIAMMIAMLTGGIDLSIVGVANLAGVTAGTLFGMMAGEGGTAVLGLGPVALGVCAALIVGLLAGLLNGFLISVLKITPILATLGTGQVFIGICLVLTGGPAIVGFPGGWNGIGNGKLLGVPLPLILFGVVCLVLSLLLTRTSFGLRLKMIGTNPKAAVYSGLRRGQMIIYSYMLTGALAAMAGILLSARINAAKSDYGGSYLLQAVLIAVLGGTNPAGGRGNVIGVALALISLTLLSSGFQMMRISNHLIDFVWGAFLIAVIALNSWRRWKGS
ncbi:ABC transporter permease [Roseicitreum antarcticum]|uniref:Monosaccharide ABC transporter membrane protein, CUT2 family (TC 3.A.1.2.-) n=2 Tax=Roseicitreum antarcticum TaxID=564137 RepID=A0A1H2YVT3_9RHOB|nr:ABC transporter permease [Roseicitreum antarcticum]SDX09145.1 monosaccharide ABC transporter membrane protein, CUT2 family (TC 3.A.1.2.-) [Roseicitreum antarcticum]